MKQNKTKELFNKVRADLEARIDSNQFGAWVRSWSVNMPWSDTSKKAYRGMNSIFLSTEFTGKSQVWGTFKNWSNKGYKIRKGSKASYAVYCEVVQRKATEDEKELIPAERELIKGEWMIKNYMFTKASAVFSIDDLDITDEQRNALMPESMRRFEHEHKLDQSIIDAMIKRSGSKLSLSESCNQPCYSPKDHKVYMNTIAQYKNAEDYYSVLFHEMIHSTMHACKRAASTRGQEPKIYAFEELVAELGAAMIASYFGFEYNESNTASYLASWQKHLDGKKIAQAAAKAQEAVELLLGAGA